MKTIKIIIIILSFNFSQSQTVDLFNNSVYPITQGIYFEDSNDFLNQYEVTWVLNSANFNMKFQFEKKIMQPSNINNITFYEDVLVGEYQYIENGIEKVNTLLNLNINHNNYIDYNLVSITDILASSYPICLDCLPNEKRLKLMFKEPALINVPCLSGSLVLKRNDENGIEKIKIFLVINMFPCSPINSVDEDSIYSFPQGQYYTLIKQP